MWQGHHSLVFSRYLGVLDILQSAIKAAGGCRFLRLDGSVSSDRRAVRKTYP